MPQEENASLMSFAFIASAPHLPGGVFRFTERAYKYSEAVKQAEQRGWERQGILPNGDTVVRGQYLDEEKLEDAARDRDARKVKKLQRTGES